MTAPRIVFRPLTTWPGQLRTDDERTTALWDSTYSDTRRLLVREAEYLDAEEVVVQLAIAESRILRSGDDLKAAARPDHPGVVVVLTLPAGDTQSLHCDLYRGRGWSRTEGWHDNLRAIAKSLEALRALDRWGATQGRQYAGFRELSSGIPMPAASQMTVEEAARFLIDRTLSFDESDLDAIVQRPGARLAAYREAAMRVHPDHGGDADTFARLVAAKEILEQHGGGA